MATRSLSVAPRVIAGIALLAALLGAAAWTMVWSERDFIPNLAFALAFGVLFFFWLLLLRRPSPAAAISLGMIAILILLSRHKFQMLLMTVTFADVMIIDADTT